MSWSSEDQQFMRMALDEAKIAASVGEIPVGAVVVRNDKVIGAGLNRCIQDHDPTAHAEIVAIRAAAFEEANYRLSGATLYVTLEPCAMCLGAMLNARLSRLVFGAYDETSGAAGSVVDLCSHGETGRSIEVNGGLCEARCSGLLQQFFAERRD